MSMDSPAAQLVQQEMAFWRRHAPFDAMTDAALGALVAAAEQIYFAPAETIASPADGPPDALFVVKSGLVTAQHGLAQLDKPGIGWQYEAGDCFPMAALMQGRAVTATYVAETDVFAWRVPSSVVQATAHTSPPLAAHLSERVLQLIQLAEREQAQRATHAALAQQAMERPLGELMRRKVLSVSPDMPLELALRAMAQRRVGSVMVVDRAQRPLGVLTRDDVLERVALPQRPLTTPIEQVMTTQLRSLSPQHTAQDAALLMSRHTLRHVPVVEDGRLVGIVSERDLFALSRLSVQRISSELRVAEDVAAVLEQAPRIGELARVLVEQGTSPRSLTALIAHLNDLLAERLVSLHAAALGLDMTQAVWLAFGSEGRAEQTIATDQDNGLLFVSAQPDLDRPRWQALGLAVCTDLDRAGYPLCKGGVMASLPACCRSAGEWQIAFTEWLHQGTPDDLLRVSIYFDARPIAGNASLAEPLLALAAGPVSPRLARLLAQNALRWRVPLSWRGALDASERNGVPGLDLKAQGAGLFVEAARVMALALGVPAQSTRERLLQVGLARGVPLAEREGWAASFDFLQGLRLRNQLSGHAPADAPNWCPMASLNDLDRRTLRLSLRVAQRLQQRLELDYLR